MAEHQRTNGYQWFDGETCMVLDRFDEKPLRFHNGGIYGPIEAALRYVAERRGWEDRTIILRLPCVQAASLSPQEGESRE